MWLGESSAFEVAPGELLAVDVPAGPAWVPLLHRLWSEGVAFMPLDERLAEPERRRLLDLARPAAVLGAGGGPRSSPAPSRSIPRSPSSWRRRAPAAPRGWWSSRATAIAGRGRRVPRRRSRRAGHDVDARLVELSHAGPHRRPARAAAGRARRRLSPSTVHERFDVDRLAREAPPGASVSLVPAMVAPARARAGRPAAGSARCSSAAARSSPALRAEAEALGATIVETYGLTESCGGVVYDGVPFEGTRGADRATRERIELRGSDRDAGLPRRRRPRPAPPSTCTGGCARATPARSTMTAGCT